MANDDRDRTRQSAVFTGGDTWDRGAGRSYGGSSYGGAGYARGGDFGGYRGDYQTPGATSAFPQQSFRGRGPKGYQRSDERIHEDVCDRLQQDDFVDASDIEVSVKGAVVVLAGTVTDRDTKRRAEDIAESVGGVREVQNQLRLASSRSTPVMGSEGGGGTTRKPSRKTRR